MIEYRGLIHGQAKAVSHEGRLRAWAILHRRVYTGGKPCCVYMPAATDGLHGVMLCHLKLQHWQIKDLAGLNHVAKDNF